jgi:radical SAM superfamily enzyme YgiQ (UPF0313 family)
MKVSLVSSPHLDHSRFQGQTWAQNGVSATRFAQRFLPMGLVSIANAADQEADISILDLNKAINTGVVPMSDSFYECTAEWLLKSSPDLVGFMTEADSYHHLIQILTRVKKLNPNVLTLLGGVHATAVHYETLRDFPDVDLIVRGEGEIPFTQLVKALRESRSLSDVPNLTFRNNGRVQMTLDVPLIDDLDTLPFPDLSHCSLSDEDVVYLEIGRGCPFKCNFCFTAPYWKRKHRIKSPGRIMSELAYFRDEFGRTDFNFTHDLFTTDRRWVLDFCQTLVRNGVSVSWTCSSRTDTLDEEQIHWLKLAGCRDIYFGMETGTAEMQRKIDKNLDIRRAREIIGKTVEAGIHVTVGFIAGLPGETRYTLRGTLDEAFHFLSSPNAVVHLFGYCPYRGSAHFDSIKGSLVLDEHFLDFPLSKDLHKGNCNLMARHFEIFARYGRVGVFEGLNENVVRAAEEFFPIMNAIRPLMCQLQHAGIDNLAMLEAWTEWIGRQNLARQRDKAGRFQGSISDFLLFLEDHLKLIGKHNDVVAELILWERYKNQIRLGEAHGSPVERRFGAENLVFTNPSVISGYFRHAPRLLEGQESGRFAFYLRQNATAAIARVGDVAALILEIARPGVDHRTLLSVLGESVSQADFGDELRRVVDDLRSEDLLLSCTENSQRFRPEAQA